MKLCIEALKATGFLCFFSHFERMEPEWEYSQCYRFIQIYRASSSSGEKAATICLWVL